MYGNRHHNNADMSKRAPYVGATLPAFVLSTLALILGLIAISTDFWFNYSGGSFGGLWRACDGGVFCNFISGCSFNGLGLDRCGEFNSTRAFMIMYTITAFLAWAAITYGLINLCTNHCHGNADPTPVGTSQGVHNGAGGHGNSAARDPAVRQAPLYNEYNGWVQTAPASTILSSIALVFGIIAMGCWIGFVERQETRAFRADFDYDWSFWVFIASLVLQLGATIATCMIPTAFVPALHDAHNHGTYNAAGAYPAGSAVPMQTGAAHHPQVIVQPEPVRV